MIEHHQLTELDKELLKIKIGEFLAEDGADCDKTTLGTVPESNTTVAYIEAQADIVFAGADIIDIIFATVCKVEFHAKDGDTIPCGSRIATISGPARFILSRERVMLNIIQRMSGIATITKRLYRYCISIRSEDIGYTQNTTRLQAFGQVFRALRRRFEP